MYLLLTATPVRFAVRKSVHVRFDHLLRGQLVHA